MRRQRRFIPILAGNIAIAALMYSIASLDAPLRFAIIACAVVATWWMIIRDAKIARRIRRLARGRCVECGYDLTGNTSGICPECGTGVPIATNTD